MAENAPTGLEVIKKRIRTAGVEPTYGKNIENANLTDLASMDASALAADPAFTGTYARPTPNTMVVLGDSITNAQNNRSFWTWARSFLGHALNITYNAGVGGNTSEQILARVQSDVVAKNPAWCHVLAGKNDLSGTDSVAMSTTIITNIQSILDRLKAAGIRPVVGTITPSASETAAVRKARMIANNWIKSLPLTRAVIVADYDAVLADQVTGEPLPSALWDSTHPGVKGAALMGWVLRNALIGQIAPVNKLANSETDPTNLLLHSRFSAGGAGSVPTDWFESGASGGARTYSKVARTDGIPGSWQRLVIPAGGATQLAQNVNVGANMTIGNTVDFRVEYRVTSCEAATSGQYLFASVAAYNGSSFTSEVFDCQYGIGTENSITFDRSGTFNASGLVIPVATTLVQCRIWASMGMTLDIDRATLVVTA